MRFWIFLACAVLQAQTPPLRWLGLSDPEMELDGLPWYSENKGELFRLPVRTEPQFSLKLWNLSKAPSGARIRFHTDSTALAIRLEYPSPPDMIDMHSFGQTGVDLEVDGVYLGTAIARKDAAPGKLHEHLYFNFADRPRTEHDITLHLPLYKPVKVLGIGVDPQAKISRAKPFALPKPIVYYGTSITQGCCASRPGMSYQAIVGRTLNMDYINLGFSGSGKGEIEMARLVASIDAACFVMDFAQNNGTVESLSRVYSPFLKIRENHPNTPILAITPIFATRELTHNMQNEGMRELIRRAVAQRIAAGDKNIQLIEGADLVGPTGRDGLTDGVHPNDLGFRWMAEGLVARLRTVLTLQLYCCNTEGWFLIRMLLPYRKLVSWRDWEIPVPDKEAIAGFLAFLGISTVLHLTVLGICWYLRR